MRGKPWQLRLRVGLAVVPVGLAVAFALGLLVEAVLLLVTVAVCALSLIPLMVDRPILRRPDGRAARGLGRIPPSTAQAVSGDRPPTPI